MSIETPATEIPETPDTESADPGNATPSPAPSAASTPPADESPFAAMLTELYDGRTAVSSPAVAPDGRRIAFVVSTIDLKENTTRTRLWLAGPGDPAPLTAGPVDGQPEWSPDGRFLAFTSRRGEKDKETTLHVMPIAGPGEVRTVATLPEVVTNLRWSPDGKHLAFNSRTRDARYDAKDESWQPPRRIENFFTQLNGEGFIVDRPAHVYVVPADGTGTLRNLTPGPFQHDGVSWLADSSGVVTSAPRHDRWDFDYAIDLHLVPLDGDIRAITTRTGIYGDPAVSPDGTRVAFIGSDDPATYPQNVRHRRDRGRRRADHVGVGGSRPDVLRHRRRACAGLDRRRDHPRHRRGPRRDAPLPHRRRRLAGAGAAQQGRPVRADVPRRRVRRSPWCSPPSSTPASS